MSTTAIHTGDTVFSDATGTNETNDAARASDAANTAESAAQTPESPLPQVAPVPSDSYSGISIASFVIGLVSIVSSWTFIAPLTGLILGIVALRKRTTERTLAIWGVALNGALLALTVLALIAVLVIASMIGFAGVAGYFLV